MIKYHSAFLEDKKTRVSISDINYANKGEHKYYCIGCGAELVPRLGKVRAGHFAHKVDAEGENCNKETYLHKLGKLMLEEKYRDDTKPFSIQLYDYQICCQRKKCEFYDKIYCSTQKKVVQDEKDMRPYYNSIVIETPIYVKTVGKDVMASFENFEGAIKLIPDLLIYNSKYKNLKDAILLEVCYSHKCEKEKIESGLRIIEVYVRNEDYIEDLLNKAFVQEDEKIYVWDRRKKPHILCYNFNAQSESSAPLYKRPIGRFIYFKKGSCYVLQFQDSKTCDKRKEKHSPYSLVELNLPSTEYIETPNTYHIGLAYLKKKGYNIKNCLLCKYYKSYEKLSMTQGMPFCCLSGKFGTPRNPSQEKAMECSYYKEDVELLRKASIEADTLYIEEV